MSSEFSIKVDGLSKCYQIYDRPQDRLKQMLIREKQKLYREFWAVRDASFSIRRGETVGIIGRNGSGKSTLLQMICGTVSPTCGHVETNGRVAALLELGAGFNTEFSGRENILLNAAILGLPQDVILERMAEIVKFSELENFIDQPIKTYSSGMYARLAFSIAINVNPEILVVDEALAVGDSRFVAKCMRRIKDIQNLGTTILFVSHDVGSVRTLCERAIWLNNGAIFQDGDVFPVTGKYMEFIFKDEDEGDSKISPASLGKKENPNRSQTSMSGGETQIPKLPNEEILDLRPITHWGSHKGIILGASIYDEYGTRKDVIEWGDLIKIVISIRVPIAISRKHLSIAFSIKDLKGTDLIVSTTRDQEDRILPEVEKFSVTFEMRNLLVMGKYVLVAAVENREYREIHYYEYFEGAHYFSSINDRKIFGIIQPSIKQIIEIV